MPLRKITYQKSDGSQVVYYVHRPDPNASPIATPRERRRKNIYDPSVPLVEVCDETPTESEEDSTNEASDEVTSPVQSSGSDDSSATESAGDDSDSEVLEEIQAKWARRDIITCFVDLAWFERAHLPVNRILQTVGWKTMVEYRNSYYPPLVRVFYNNLRRTGNWILESTVGGVNVRITPTLLADTFDLPLGRSPIIDNGSIIEENYDHLAILNSMCRNDIHYDTYPFRISDTKFHFIPQLLHKLILKIILPRSGSKNHVSHLDLYLLWAMMRGRTVSLPHLMMHYMAVTRSTCRAMPYAYLLTQIFEDQGVDIRRLGGAPVSLTDRFGASNLYQMKYKFLPSQKKWVRPTEVPDYLLPELGPFQSPPREPPVESFDERDLFDYNFLDLPEGVNQNVPPQGDQAKSSHARDHAPSQAPPSAPASSSQTTPNLLEMQSFLSQLQSQLFSRLDSLDHRMRAIEDQQARLLRQQQQPPPPNPDA